MARDVLGGEGIEVDKETKAGGLPGFENLTPDEQEKQLQKMFREVFSTPHGKIVLGIILEDLYYFNPCAHDETRALNNYAKYLLAQRLGINNHTKIIDSLLSC